MMQQHEYKVEMSGSETLQRLLNDEGRQVWRVACIDFRTWPEQTIVLFERRIEN